MGRQAFLDTIKRINEFVENPMPVEGGPQALEAQSVEMEELINELLKARRALSRECLAGIAR